MKALVLALSIVTVSSVCATGQANPNARSLPGVNEASLERAQWAHPVIVSHRVLSATPAWIAQTGLPKGAVIGAGIGWRRLIDLDKREGALRNAEEKGSPGLLTRILVARDKASVLPSKKVGPFGRRIRVSQGPDGQWYAVNLRKPKNVGFTVAKGPTAQAAAAEARSILKAGK